MKPSVLVIGAGLGGIAVGVKLRAAGFRDFEIVDQNSDPGGTWWTNTYPGCEVDIASYMYSYSFHRFRWTRTHARQPELLAYINDVVDSHHLRPHMTFGVRIDSVTWSEEHHGYIVHATDGIVRIANVVVSAVGLLSHPRIPALPGLEKFQGEVFHSSRWDHGTPISGRRVAVIGVGSTGTQLIPTIAPRVGELLVFQREPGWILPKGDRDYTDEERHKYFGRIYGKWIRWKAFANLERRHVGGEVYREGSKRNLKAKERALKFIADVFRDRPDLQKAVTPQYAFSGKRIVLSDDFYPALLRDNVHFVPSSVVRVTAAGLVDANGQEHQADVVVMATGFSASDFLPTLDVKGRIQTLKEVWADGAYALLGMCVPGFPNFYIMYGPNTNGGGPITANLERQAKYIVRNIRTMSRTGVTAIDVKRSYVDRYNSWLQRRLAGTTWQNANNYMKSPSGRVVTQWPNSLITYTLLTRLLRIPASVRRRTGTGPNVSLPSDSRRTKRFKSSSA